MADACPLHLRNSVASESDAAVGSHTTATLVVGTEQKTSLARSLASAVAPAALYCC